MKPYQELTRRIEQFKTKTGKPPTLIKLGKVTLQLLRADIGIGNTLAKGKFNGITVVQHEDANGMQVL